MGYPMTYKRVVNRNGLMDGDYGKSPARHRKVVITNATDSWATKIYHFDSVAKRCDEYEKSFELLAGDLRRLENDSQDEQLVCMRIAAKTGIGADVVAAVLLEFFST
jgi:hypothetical protein